MRNIPTGRALGAFMTAVLLGAWMQGCLFDSPEKKPLESWERSYQENLSFKDTIMVWNFPWLEKPDTVAWVSLYPSDSVVFTYWYSNDSSSAAHADGYREDLFFTIPPATDTFRIDTSYPEKVRVALLCSEPECGFKPVIAASISGWRTGSKSFHVEGKAIYSFAKSKDSIAAHGRDTITFSGTFKASPPR
jgi:hypothetical protein